MATRDYAAPLKQERRKSIWAKLTRSLNLTVDWESAPPLTTALREQVPEIPITEAPLRGPSPVPASLQPGNHTVVFNNSHLLRSDLVEEDGLEARYQNSSTQTGRPHQRYRQRLSPQMSVRQATHQQDNQGPNLIHTEVSPQLPPIRTHSPLWTEDLSEAARLTPLPPIVVATTPTQQQRNAAHATYHRNIRGHLVASPQATHPSPRVNTIRRRPVQSSLRNPVNRDTVCESSGFSNGAHGVSPAARFHPGRYSHSAMYSPSHSTEPHGISQPPSYSSFPARHLESRSQAQTSLCAPTLTSGPCSSQPTLQELQSDIARTTHPTELEGSLQYDPPSLPDISALPRPQFTRRADTTREGSTASLSTFQHSNPSSLPLNLLQANIEGLKQRVRSGLGSRHSWKANMVRLRSELKGKVRWLWDLEDDRGTVIEARLDVFFFGPLPGCMCGVCVKKRGEDPATATSVAHEVPIKLPADCRVARFQERCGLLR